MNKNKNKIQLPKVGEMIEITARHYSEKVSPLLRVGNFFMVKNIAFLSDKTPVLEVAHPKRKKAVLRANAARFEWRIISPETIKEDAFRKEVAEETSKLLTDFTKEEQINIAFVPLIFNHIAWIYAMKAVQISVNDRIEMLKKVTRGIRKLRADYEREVSKDLDYRHQKHVEDETERFVSEYQYNFTILYFSVIRELDKKMPDYDHKEMRAYAIISMLMIKFVDEHNKRMDALIASKLGKSRPSVRMQVMDALYACMDAYASVSPAFDYSFADIKSSMEIIRCKLNQIEFEIL